MIDLGALRDKAAAWLRYLEKRRIIPERIYRRVKNFTLTGKINFIILSATMPMLLLLALLFIFLYIQLKSQLDQTLIQKMIATRNAYNYYERTTLVYAKMLAENPYIKKELLVEAINVGPILRVCNQVQSSVYLNRITVHDRRGYVVVRSHKTSSFGEDESKLLHVERALKKGENTALIIQDGDQLVLQNTVPVYLEGETVGAITAGYILNEQFARSLSNLTQSGILFTVNGKIVSASYPAFMKSGNSLDYPEQNRTWSETIKIRYGDGNTATSSRVDMRYLPIVTEQSGQEKISAGIVVAVNPPFSRLILGLLIWGSFLFSLGVVFFGILLALKIGHNIANYAKEISGAMTVYAQGDMQRRMHKSSADELGLVASGFNLLAEELQKKIREIQEANETLEVKVIERTKDLHTALSDITTLKEKQEGDYLLTDLLIKPLTGKPVEVDRVRAEFYIDQKKKYNFRGKRGDIGGDYCLLASLRFGQDAGEWLFFFNGDAMGKSTQGASGALICGVTLHSILARYSKKESIALEPQQFLTLVYRELNDIFMLFDASMLMSAAWGVIQARTGLMYYLNCEHPWSVLYRDGQAAFIEDELTMRKLGMPLQDRKISLKRMNLSAGDVLLLGSDGRDDLEIREQIDSDEKRFLEAVEYGNGNIGDIVTYLDKQGLRTDDLSLMKIEILAT